ncbi:MAG: competence/damage-inducible protein A [Clostridia bacterium]|nr:competence/damage-inducible protein A [Clostridia bacterium]
MNVKLISIGKELLLGEIVDTNSVFISEQLSIYGIEVSKKIVLDDNYDAIKEAMKYEFIDADILILTGGLGPTDDDVTKEAVCDFFESELVLCDDVLQSISSYFQRRGRKMVSSNLKQAYFPKNCKILHNPNGTAPGFIIEKDNRTAIVLPGPPHEMKPMFSSYVEPYLLKRSGKKILTTNINTYGISESELEYRLKPLMAQNNNLSMATYANFGEIRVRLSVCDEKNDDISEILSQYTLKAKHLIGDEFVYGVDCDNMQSALVKLLIEKNMKIATAESCTGGLLSKCITDVSGASQVFECGVCSYSNRIKEKILGVDPHTLQKHGAVSEQTAREMAQGVLELSDADIAVSITGLAGPGGGTAEKPVGLVFIGVATRKKTIVKQCNFNTLNNKSRESIRRHSQLEAMKLLLDVINEQK